MSDTIHELEAEWERFETAQRRNAESDGSYGDGLVQYQKLKRKVHNASSDWEKQRVVYLAQLNQPTVADTDCSSSSLPELIDAHRTLSTTIRKLSEKPNGSMEELMRLWGEFHTVHHTLILRLRADEK